jgi:hypothetical protein
LSPARPAQSQAAEPQDTLEMCKQHLNALSVTAQSLERLGLGQRRAPPMAQPGRRAGA